MQFFENIPCVNEMLQEVKHMNRPQIPVRCGCLKEKNLLSSVGRNSLPYDFDGNKHFPVKDTSFIIKCTDTLSCFCAFLQRETKI